jgi:hypothetical protein
MHTRPYHAGRPEPRAGIALRALALARHAAGMDERARTDGDRATADMHTLNAACLLYEMEEARR